MLFETGFWVVHGQHEQVLCCAASLHQAVVRSAEYAAAGAVVVAFFRQSADNIVVSADQIDRLSNSIDLNRMKVSEARFPGDPTILPDIVGEWLLSLAEDRSRPLDSG
jgi:hypothetical protein